MKRLSSAPRSYLRQLTAPLPATAALLRARRPLARGAGPVLDAIPPIVDFVENIAYHAGAPDPPAAASPPRNAPPYTPEVPANVLSSVRSAGPHSDLQRDAISPSVAAAREAVRTTTASRHEEDVHEPVAPRRIGGRRSVANGEAAPQRRTRLDAEPASSLRFAFAKPSSQTLVSSSANSNAEAKGGRGVQVHIGTVEVRVAAPPPSLPQPSPNQRRDPISNQTGRPAHAEPLSRGLSWSYGLVQG